MTAYNSGEFGERVELYSRGASTLDAHGQDTITWTLNGTFWAQLVPMSAREVFAAQQIVAEQTMKFRIRYHSTVAATWRLVWQGKSYDITSVLPFGGRRDRTEIICVQGVKDGR